MVQVTKDKKHSVYTNWEWNLAWIAVFIIGMSTGVIITCSWQRNEETKKEQKDEYKIVPESDSISSDIAEEKHFDCIVSEVMETKSGVMYVTECGVPFYTKTLHSVGDTLRNFNSPKHK